MNDGTLQQMSFVYEGTERDPVWIAADPKWCRRMLDNLISNAVKHNPPGTVVTVRTGRSGTEALIEIEDNGSGMDAETRRKLFERYYRGTNTEERSDGAGLGMSIARSIVHALQGSIEVHSIVGEGTRILLRFPSVYGASENKTKAPHRQEDAILMR